MSSDIYAPPSDRLTTQGLVAKFRKVRGETNAALAAIGLLNPPATQEEIFSPSRPISANPSDSVRVNPRDGDIIHEAGTEFGPSLLDALNARLAELNLR